MTRNTAQTSINSYYDLKDTPKLGRLQQKVYDTIRTHGPIHNRYIAELTELEINVVTPRVKELREMELVKKAYTARDPKTKKLVNYWCQAKVKPEADDFLESLIRRSAEAAVKPTPTHRVSNKRGFTRLTDSENCTQLALL